MKRSTDRVLTTHVGSLARPDELVPILKAKDRAQPYDRDAYARLVRAAVTESVRKQTEAGVDVVNDGEQGRASFFGYIVERFTGFERKSAPRGQDGNVRAQSRDYRAFPDYYAWSERIAESAGGTRSRSPPWRGCVHGQGDLPGPGGDPGRSRQPPHRREGSAARGGLRAGHRTVVHLRHADQRVLPDSGRIRAGPGRRPARGVPRHRRRRLHPPDRRPAAGDVLHDERGRQHRGLPPVGGRTGGGHQRVAARHSSREACASTPATASTWARASSTWS